MFPWEVKDVAQGDGFCVSIHSQVTGATNPDKVELRITDDCDDLSAGETLIKLVNVGRDGRTTILDRDVFVPVVWWNENSFVKTYFPLHRRHLPEDAISLWSRDFPAFDGPIHTDSITGIGYGIDSIPEHPVTTRIRVKWRGTKEELVGQTSLQIVDTHSDVYVVGARDLKCKLSSERRVECEIEWEDSHDTTVLVLTMPDTASGIIAFDVQPSP